MSLGRSSRVSSRLLALAVTAALAACSAMTGCASESSSDDDDPAVVGGGDGNGTSEDAIVGEHQLTGSELPDHTLALTFDDGPGQRTSELADYLATENIHATFFINGKNVAGRQAALDSVIGRGHRLGNHTQNHLQLTSLSADKVISEVTLTDAFIVTAQPDGPWLLRPPFGAWSGRTAAAVNGTPMKKYTGSIFWDVGGVLTATAAADWDCWGKGVAIDKCGALYMNEMNTRKRGIVLMHDVHNKTIDMVKLIVPQLKAAGWKFATLEETPSVKRALAGASAAAAGPNDCSSSSLGRTVPEQACVQSRSDTKWHRCVQKEWVDASGADDPKCTGGKFPIQ